MKAIIRECHTLQNISACVQLDLFIRNVSSLSDAVLRLTGSETKVARMHDWKIGICHGHQIVPWGDKDSMAMLQRQLDVDVLITGHTHKFAVDVHEGALFVNPGSATGAYSGMQRCLGLPSFLATCARSSCEGNTPISDRSRRCSEVVPSFLLLDVQEGKLTIYVYELVPSESDPDQLELKVQELKHSK